MLPRMVIPRAVAIVLDADRVLVIKRYLRQTRADDCVMCEATNAPGPACTGHHYAVLPGGHVEPGESPEDAALRELEEETTLTATIDRLLWTSTHNKRPAYYFLMTDVAGTPRLSGDEAIAHSANNSYELLWATPGELGRLDMHPPDVQFRLDEILFKGLF